MTAPARLSVGTVIGRKPWSSPSRRLDSLTIGVFKCWDCDWAKCLGHLQRVLLISNGFLICYALSIPFLVSARLSVGTVIEQNALIISFASTETK